jgi:hypothetical protein
MATNTSGILYASTTLEQSSHSDSDSSCVDSLANISHISVNSASFHTDLETSIPNSDCPPTTSSPKAKIRDITSRNQLRILTINFQSVKKKGRLLESIIATTEPDIIIGTETWLSDNIHSEEIISPELNYDVYRRDRHTDAHGGVMIAARRELMFSNVTKSETLELISGTIKLRNQTPVILAGYYRPPNRTEESYLAAAQQEFASIRLKHKTAVMIVGGDFNIPDVDWSTTSITGTQYPRRVSQAFLNIVADNNLEQQVTFPTRKDSTLDLILSSHPGFKLRCKALPSIGNSDHDIVLYDTALSAPRKKPQRRKIYLWKKANMESIRSEISSFKLITASQDANTYWEDFREMLRSMIERNVPSKLTLARQSLPWMTGNIKRAIKRKQKAHRKAR